MTTTTKSDRVDAFVALPALALVGVSRTGKKFGNTAVRELRAKGYRVYPVHPEATEINGVRCYPRLADLPEPVTGLVVVVTPRAAIGVLAEAAAAGIRAVWLQQGSDSADVVARCRELGMEPIAGECILMYARPTGVHRLHGWIHRTFRATSAGSAAAR
ncbi:MAG TPA: CoA-binding protein [Vicinamibacterales bacterium]|nr:CoA-binding protein [Vicinamibacterales bacterium]